MREHPRRTLHGYRTRRWSVGTPAVLIPTLLQLQFTVTRPNNACVTDISLHSHVARLALSAVAMDPFSRQIVGGSARPSIHRELVLDAVLTAVRRRRPRGTLMHSDRGTQYGSDAWRPFCRANRLEPSMRRKGNCWDSAVAESFFGSPKKERVKKQIYKTRDLVPTSPTTSIRSTVAHDATVISVASAPSSSTRLTNRAGTVSIDSWEIQTPNWRQTVERLKEVFPKWDC